MYRFTDVRWTSVFLCSNLFCMKQFVYFCKNPYFFSYNIQKKVKKMDYPNRLAELRLRNNFSSKEIADKLNISEDEYLTCEQTNEFPAPYISVLCRLYSVSADYILGLTNVFNPRK